MKKFIITLAVLVVAGVGYYFYNQKSSETPVNEQASSGEILQYK